MPPTFEQVTFFYEVLMRFSDQPATRGELVGAHLQTMTQTTMDGSVIATQANPPQQLALVEQESGQKLNDVLGSMNAQTIIQNQHLTAYLIAERSRSEALSEELRQALLEIARINSLQRGVDLTESA